MRRSIKLVIRIDLFDEVNINVNSEYSALPKHLLEEFADLTRRFMADYREELTDPTSVAPTTKSVAIPPRG